MVGSRGLAGQRASSGANSTASRTSFRSGRHPRCSWLIAFVYLLCGTLRLARFNSDASESKKGGEDFEGFPIPAAAGVVASLTLFMLWFETDDRVLGHWKFGLPVLLLFLSFMMFSHVRYPSFKSINWRTQRSIPRFLTLILILIFSAMQYEWMPAILFTGFLVYGFVRPLLPTQVRSAIEDESPDDIDSERIDGNGEKIPAGDRIRHAVFGPPRQHHPPENPPEEPPSKQEQD